MNVLNSTEQSLDQNFDWITQLSLQYTEIQQIRLNNEYHQKHQQEQQQPTVKRHPSNLSASQRTQMKNHKTAENSHFDNKSQSNPFESDLNDLNSDLLSNEHILQSQLNGNESPLNADPTANNTNSSEINVNGQLSENGEWIVSEDEKCRREELKQIRQNELNREKRKRSKRFV